MKKILILIGTMSASFAMAQVGINTSNPQTTLDVTAKNATGTTTNVDGFLAPRVTRQRAQNMTGVPTSTLVYINNVSTGTQTGTTINVDAVGYYYFNGTIWVKMDNPSNKSNSVNIYNSNGTLESNRTVAQADNTLAFTSTATTGTNHFSVDGNTFSVNAANHRIGLGTTNPQNKLDLGTDAGLTITDAIGKKMAVYNNAGGTSFYGLGVSPARLQFHASSAATDAPGAVLASNGNFGIGTTDPTNRLDVRSTTSGAVKIVDGTQGANKVLTSDANGVATWQNTPASASTNIYNSNGTLESNRTVAQANNTLAFTSTATTGTNHFSVDGNTFSVNAANHRIGLGTTNPQNKLDLGTDVGLAATDAAAKKLAVYNNAGGTSFYGLGVSPTRLQFHASSAATDAPGAVLLTNGNFGIGTPDPTNRLDVRSTTSGAVKIVDGTQGASKVLTSDANGVATWQNIPATTNTNIYNSNGTLESNRTVAQANNTLAFTSTATTGTNHFSVDGNTLSVNAANHRIGLGTTNPQNKLDLGTDAGSTITDPIGKKLAVYNNAGGTSFYGLGISSARLQFHASSAATDAPGAVLASNGNFGIGTTDPTNRLDVRSTTSGAVRIVDGTQGANKVLTSDANGVATWVTNNTSNPVVMSSMGPGVTLNASIAGTQGTNTGTTITLPANSKYVVICYMLVGTKNQVPSNGYGWIQSTFTESPSSNTHSSDIQGSYFISGAIIPNQNTFSMITGSIIINNTTSSPKTYYYRVRIANSTNLGAGNEIVNFGGTAWGENNLYAVPIN